MAEAATRERLVLERAIRSYDRLREAADRTVVAFYRLEQYAQRAAQAMERLNAGKAGREPAGETVVLHLEQPVTVTNNVMNHLSKDEKKTFPEKVQDFFFGSLGNLGDVIGLGNDLLDLLEKFKNLRKKQPEDDRPSSPRNNRKRPNQADDGKGPVTKVGRSARNTNRDGTSASKNGYSGEKNADKKAAPKTLPKAPDLDEAWNKPSRLTKFLQRLGFGKATHSFVSGIAAGPGEMFTDRTARTASDGTVTAIGKLMKVGRHLMPKHLNLVSDLTELATADNKRKAATQVLTSKGLAAAGAFAGSLILPGAGTLAGGFVGGWLGDKLGGFLGEKLFGRKKAEQQTGPDESVTNRHKGPGTEINRHEIVRTESNRTFISPASLFPGALPKLAIYRPVESEKPIPIRIPNPPGISPSFDVPPSNTYNIKVDGVEIHMPKEKIDEEDLAMRIGREIVRNMSVALENRA